jgi:hypothetical protein
METLHNYFIYNKDYPRMNSIFKDLSSKLEAIHDKNMIVSNLTSNGIIHDDNDSFFFETVVPSNNFEEDKKRNILDFSKLILGAFLSLEIGFRDFSKIDDSWVKDNCEEICDSIKSEEFESDYFKKVISNGKEEYYHDYLNNKRQNEELSGKGNVQSHKKVLANAASQFYMDMYKDENETQVDNNEKKSASLSTIFFPILLGFSIVFLLFVISMIK